MYRCWKCKKDIKELDPSFVHCPFCACRVLYKMRPPVAREILAE
ncbi:MAG: DNA-directed RNA polymerase subunit P [Candidatus Micrarchaeota archaeon]